MTSCDILSKHLHSRELNTCNALKLHVVLHWIILDIHRLLLKDVFTKVDILRLSTILFLKYQIVCFFSNLNIYIFYYSNLTFMKIYFWKLLKYDIFHAKKLEINGHAKLQ